MQQRVCRDCGESKSVDQFSKDRSRKDGLKIYCKPCCVARTMTWQAVNPERSKASKRNWYEANRENEIERMRRHRQVNLGQERERNRRWSQENPDKATAKVARRRAAKLQQTIPLTPEQEQEIREMYTSAKRISEETGVKHHVDHIVPLLGENVSGLHVPWNLRVVPAHENLAKGNKVDPTTGSLIFRN